MSGELDVERLRSVPIDGGARIRKGLMEKAVEAAWDAATSPVGDPADGIEAHDLARLAEGICDYLAAVAPDEPTTKAGRRLVAYLRDQADVDAEFQAPQASSAYRAAARTVEVGLVQIEREAHAREADRRARYDALISQEIERLQKTLAVALEEQRAIWKTAQDEDA